ncbi:MAG: Crp/Fnr family transcriptional regulator [Clostridia bacterium]|nr:Crp/Fnr family transcriptional regulator [Clostridia bacterium]
MVVTEKDLQTIFKAPLFAGVRKNQALRIFDLCNCEIKSFEKNEVILASDTREKKAGILLDGRARVTTADAERGKILRELSAKDVFGIASLFSDAPYVTNITSLTPTRVLLLPELAVRYFLENDRAFLYNYLGFLSGRIRYLNTKIRFFTAGSAERRLALYLLSFGKSDVKIDLSLSALADLLDLGRASLYRAFDALEKAGYIKKEGKRISILRADDMRKKYQHK